MSKKIKWLTVLACSLVTFVAWCVAIAFDMSNARHSIALFVAAFGVIWLATPNRIRHWMSEDPRYDDVDLPDDWQDFVAMASAVGSCFLFFAPINL